MPTSRMTIAYTIIRTLIQIAMLLLSRTTARGLERLPRQGAAVVVCNHLSALDPAVLVGVLPRPIALMSKIENRRGLLKIFMPLVGAFTIRRGMVDRYALQTASAVLAKGELLGMFPEGTRSKNGQLGHPHAGAVLLALQAGTPIIPVAITGTQHVFLKQFPWLGFPQITVTIGTPFLPEPDIRDTPRSDRNRMAEQMMERIAALLPPEYRGPYKLHEEVDDAGDTTAH